MARNKITDLNDHLFAQLERLNDETMPEAGMEMEVKKAIAMSKVAGQIINANKLVLSAVKLIGDGRVDEIPEQFGLKQLGSGGGVS